MKRWKKRKVVTYYDMEKQEYKFYIDYIVPNMVVFDIGANVGFLTLLFSKLVGKGGEVHSFEASSATFSKLERVVKGNSCSNVFLNNLAVADQCGEQELFIYDEDHSGWNTFAHRPVKPSGPAIEPTSTERVQTIDLDTYCRVRHISKIDLLKIDVEGAELNVLMGAQDLLAKKLIRCIIFEFGQTTFDMGHSPERIESYFLGKGYKLKNLIPGYPLFPRGAQGQALISMIVADMK